MNQEPMAPLAAERLLMEKLPSLPGSKALVISPGRAQSARWLITDRKFQQVTAFYIDLYQAAAASAALGLDVNPGVGVVCAADLPDEELDLVLLPVLKRGEAELTRDWMQQAHQRLKLDGYLAMAVDHAADRWVHEQMTSMFSKVSCNRSNLGCVYWARKTQPLKKIKQFETQFSFRDDQALIQAISRPGVFAHRRVDNGARQLISVAEIGADDHVLDMGCGAGTVALAVAQKTSGVVHAVDSNARAIESVERSAKLNQITNIQTHLNADGQLTLPRLVDVVLANPPYYGDDAIAQHFVDVGLRSLQPGGALLVVTKNPRWYHAYFDGKLDDIAFFEAGNYYVCCGRQLAS